MTKIMMPLRWMLLALLLAVSLQVPVNAARSSSTRREIQAQCDRQAQAFMNGDLDAIGAQMAPDYTAEWNGRSINREQWLTMARRIITLVKYHGHVTNSILRFTSTGSRASARVSQVASVTIQGSKGQHHIISRNISRQTWVHTSSGWKILHAALLSVHATVDGKLVRIPGQ